MKKIILTGCLAVATLFASSVNAQTYAEVEKPTDATPFSIETLIGGNDVLGLNWNAPAIRGRYFVDNNIAVRLQLGIGDGTGRSMSETSYFYENPDGTGEEGTQEISRSSLAFQIGGEYHFLGTQKLDPYAALGINFSTGKSVTTWNDVGGDPTTQTPNGYTEDFTAEFKGGFFGVGAQLGLGMDFYFVENIYAGLELGVGFHSISHKNREGTAEFAGTVLADKAGGAYDESFLSTYSNIRLGWRF